MGHSGHSAPIESALLALAPVLGRHDAFAALLAHEVLRRVVLGPVAQHFFNAVIGKIVRNTPNLKH